ncbi:MmcQ/YjbR family DNA-binding protein [Ktedonospora formicarum]|uniref:Phosphoribosylglycinamide formyltransferase n=1 Tax=Ktedonospora formicarum TaxID=2778364 RepID=A0A8J3MQN1_9CHLR|nr:MmcQ/YjbR family DNA-binding protein [Ktedonospora formicarum]GHO42778.1 phosphoribosylglycinamide formyltransferase [Ktedonospora formicarum]
MTKDELHQLRVLCLAFPEAIEDGDGVGNPAFKVRAKIFALRHLKDDRMSMWCKAPDGVQRGLVESEPERFFVPPYVGRYGWIGIWLDDETDWDLVADLVRDSYCMTAPKRLVAQLH